MDNLSVFVTLLSGCHGEKEEVKPIISLVVGRQNIPFELYHVWQHIFTSLSFIHFFTSDMPLTVQWYPNGVSSCLLLVTTAAVRTSDAWTAMDIRFCPWNIISRPHWHMCNLANFQFSYTFVPRLSVCRHLKKLLPSIHPRGIYQRVTFIRKLLKLASDGPLARVGVRAHIMTHQERSNCLPGHPELLHTSMFGHEGLIGSLCDIDIWPQIRNVGDELRF